ncbi:MAG: hypothetical protein ACRDXF_07765 [Acidimicrobiia bacterium]
MGDQASDRSRVIDWLLAGDPAIRWQTMRDLAGAEESEWKPEQATVATEGWGARLLEHQDQDGRWTPKLYGRKWISTTYTMVLLRRMGLPRSDPRALKSCRLFLKEGLGTRRNSDTCVSAMVLALLYWFDVEDPLREPVLGHLLDKQLGDGGWNCEADSRHGSFHTTASALEALRECAVADAPGIDEIEAAETRGREFFLRHRMLRSHRSGEIVNERFLRFSFPPRWHYDVLRGLDYFWSAGSLGDRRLEDAIDVVVEKRDREGRWPLQQRWPGETWFEMETVGEPSRWNTLRAMRVLDGWSGEK